MSVPIPEGAVLKARVSLYYIPGEAVPLVVVDGPGCTTESGAGMILRAIHATTAMTVLTKGVNPCKEFA